MLVEHLLDDFPIIVGTSSKLLTLLQEGEKDGYGASLQKNGVGFALSFASDCTLAAGSYGKVAGLGRGGRCVAQGATRAAQQLALRERVLANLARCRAARHSGRSVDQVATLKSIRRHAERLARGKVAVPRTGNVVELEVGRYGDLARRSVRDGLTPDHIPSFASVKADVERQLGRQLTAAEETALRNQTNAIVVKTRSHMDVSRTYGGRNTPQQILQDSLDQQRAFQLDRQAWRQRLIDEGHSPQAVDDAFRLLDDLNRQAGRY